MAISAVAAARAVIVAGLAGVPVSQTAPSPIPRRYVRVTRAGGGRRRELDVPRILVECFASTAAGAPDGQQAEQDAYTAVDALQAAADSGPWAGGWITCWETDTIVDFPDPDQAKHSRWQFSGMLYLLTYN
jgi:hypothetical protein